MASPFRTLTGDFPNVPPVPAVPGRGAWTAAALPRTKGLMAACHIGVAAHSLTEGGRDARAGRPGPLGHIPETPLPGALSRDPPISGRALTVAAGTALAAAGLTAVPAAPPAAAATSTDAVTVNATSGLGTIPPGAIGLNTAVYDSDMNDAPIPGLLKAAGIDALRYPGGSYSDIYNWQTSTAADGGYVAPGTSFSRLHEHRQCGRRAADHHAQLRHRHPGAGRRLGAERRRHQQLRHQVLGGRQRGVRQRHLRRQLGDRLALRHVAERHPGDRRQRAVADLQLRPGRVRRQREAVHLRDARGGRERQGVRGADHARLLAGRRDELASTRSPGTRPC